MTFGGCIARRLSTLASMLAFVAAIVLAAGIHPPHAMASGETAGHAHFSTDCVKADLGKQHTVNGPDGVAPNHADCAPLFDPGVRLLSAPAPAFVRIAVPAPRDRLSRQIVTSFDPPPPRA